MKFDLFQENNSMKNMYFTSLNIKLKQNVMKKIPEKIKSTLETNFKTLLNKPVKFNQLYYNQQANLTSIDQIDSSSNQLSQLITIPMNYDITFKYDDNIYFLTNWKYFKYDQKLNMLNGTVYGDIYHCSEQYYSKVFHLNYSMFEKSFLTRFISTTFDWQEFESFFDKLNQIKSNQTANQTKDNQIYNQINFEGENDQSQMDVFIVINAMIILIVLTMIIWIMIERRQAKRKRKTGEKVQFINQEKPGINVILIKNNPNIKH